MHIAYIAECGYNGQMDSRFEPYNTHHVAPEAFWKLDKHLRALKAQVYQYQHPLIEELPRTIPGIYTIGGSRQIGKTTLLKQWMAALMEGGIPPQSIIFMTGELIDDHHVLVDSLQKITEHKSSGDNDYIIIDEITYVDKWDRGIKFAVDAGMLDDCIVILTGSDLTLMQAARMTFPGRRGVANEVDFHIYSLSFREFLTLKKSIANLDNICQNDSTPDDEVMKTLYKEFENYQKHGGYLTAINDIARDGEVNIATLKTHSDWIRGDVLKRDKSERYLKEIINAIIKRYNKQVTWNNISDALSIDSHKTVADYCELLSTMDALFIQGALMEDKLVAAPKKARKLTFTDPFIYHALKQWLNPVANPNETINHDLDDAIISSDLVEAIVSNHYRRYYPTYYIKAEGEIDVAYVDKNKFWPIEVKWRNQLRPKDIKQLSKYKRAKILSKSYHTSQIDSIPIIPLPLALLRPPFEIVKTLPVR